jgi:hypothetical protein
MDRTEGKLWIRGKPRNEGWKDWQEVYSEEAFKTGPMWFTLSINDKEDRIKIVPPEDD